MTPEEQAALYGRIGGLTAWSRHDADTMTRGAKAGFRRKFELQVDPDGVLPPDELAKRTDRAMRAYMLKLAAASAKARKRRAA